jgi:WD repeat-containing protein 76
MPSFAERRKANLAANNAELAKINATKKLRVPKETTKKATTTPRTRVKREAPVKREPALPTRRSARNRGEGAEENLKRGLDDVLLPSDKPRPTKRTRLDGDVSLGDIALDDKKYKDSWRAFQDKGLGVPARGAAAGVRTFTEDDVEETKDPGLKNLRLRMSGLKLYEKFPVPGMCLFSFPPSTTGAMLMRLRL